MGLEVQLRQRDGKGMAGFVRTVKEKSSQIPGLRGLELEKSFVSKPEDVLSFRRRLGLPNDGPIHVVYLFLECTFLRIRASQDRTSDFSTHSRAHLAAGADL